MPAIDAAVPARFSYISPNKGKAFTLADNLAQHEILRRSHWTGDPIESCAKALGEFADLCCPNRICETWLVYDDNAHGSDYSSRPEIFEHYAKDRKLAKPPKHVSALYLCAHADSPKHGVIGPQLHALEEWQPGAGQTVLFYLHKALDWTVRACDPRSGYGWCQQAYWWGEVDEEFAIEDQLEDAKRCYEANQKKHNFKGEYAGPFNEEKAKEELDFFTKAKFDAAIPSWAGSGNIRPWSLKKLLHCQPKDRRFRHTLIATAKAAQAMHAISKDKRHRLTDNHLIDDLGWEVSAYLLRWHRVTESNQDPLAMVFDDTINTLFNDGCKDCNINNAFVFHDRESLILALNRLRELLQLTHLAENILRSLRIKWL